MFLLIINYDILHCVYVHNVRIVGYLLSSEEKNSFRARIISYFRRSKSLCFMHVHQGDLHLSLTHKPFISLYFDVEQPGEDISQNVLLSFPVL